jgi:P27 family predicted phage terminase small subunit
MPGRRPKPTELRRAQGNPGHRALNKREPKPTGVPRCPTHLDDTAKAEWRRVSGELVALGLLTSVDRAALAAYCASYSKWVNADIQIQKFGSVIKSPKSGFPIPNPYCGIGNTALDQMRKFLCEFGMTPASRSRIQVAPTTSVDPFAEFMAGIGAEDVPAVDANEVE